jgi:hypothetical protein
MTLERNGIVPAPEPRSLKACLLVADLRQSRADFQPRDCSGAVNAIHGQRYECCGAAYSQQALFPRPASDIGAGRARPVIDRHLG